MAQQILQVPSWVLKGSEITAVKFQTATRWQPRMRFLGASLLTSAGYFEFCNRNEVVLEQSHSQNTE